MRQCTIAGFLTAPFPDCDYLLHLFNGDITTCLNYHRGPTHSVLLLKLSALLLVWLLSRRFRGECHWKVFYTVSCISLGVRIAGDIITSYGTMIFAPFSDWRASLDTTIPVTSRSPRTVNSARLPRQSFTGEMNGSDETLLRLDHVGIANHSPGSAIWMHQARLSGNRLPFA